MNISSCVMIGMKFSKVYKVEEVTSEVTKYNEDTGVPYKKEVKTKKHYLFDVEMPEPEQLNPKNWRYGRSHIIWPLLQDFHIEYDECYAKRDFKEKENIYDHFFIGRVIKSEEDDNIISLEMEELKELPFLIQRTKDVFGKFNCKEEVGLFIINRTTS